MKTKVEEIETDGYYKKTRFIGKLAEISPIFSPVGEEFFRVDFIDKTFFFARDAGCFVWRKGITYTITAEKTADRKMYQVNKVEEW